MVLIMGRLWWDEHAGLGQKLAAEAGCSRLRRTEWRTTKGEPFLLIDGLRGRCALPRAWRCRSCTKVEATTRGKSCAWR